MLDTADAVFEVLGGLHGMAELTRGDATTERQYKVVSNWKAAGAFPSKTYVVITKALSARGCRAPASLWGMVAAEAAE